MKLKHFLIAVGLLICSIAVAQSISLKQLCSYDAYCKRLVSGGELKQPDETLMNLLKRNRAAINAAARRYGVDPRAIVGAILAENTLNVSQTDSVQNFLSVSGIAKRGKIFGQNIGTIGLGQINCQTAEGVERYFAQKEKRPFNSNVCSELNSVGGSINNVAKIVRHAQEVYAANGINVAGNIGVLTTLYNLGKVEERAARTKATKAAPRVNYFGFFVLSQASNVNEVVGRPAPAKVAAKPAPVPVPAKGKVAAKPTPIPTVEADEAAPDEDLPEVTSLKASRNFEVADLVPACNEKNTLFTRSPVNPTPSTSTVSKGSDVYEVGRTVDCSMKAWILVQTSDGKKGWVKESDLANNTTKKVQAGTLECKASDPSCDDKIARLVQGNQSFLLDTDDNTGAHQMQITMRSGSRYSQASHSRGFSAIPQRKKISVSDTSSTCFASNPTNAGSARNSTTKPAKRNDALLTESEIRQFTSKLEQKTTEWKAEPEKVAKAANYLGDLYYCKEGCSVDKTQLAQFLDSDGVANPPEIVRTMSLSKTMVPEKDVAAIFKKCSELFNSGSSGMGGQISYLLESAIQFDDNRSGPFDLSKAPTVEKLKVACEKELPAKAMQASAGCTNCGANLNGKSGSTALRDLINSELNDTTGAAAMELSTEIGLAREASRCVYSPGATLTQMRKFLENDCVDFVTAPDLTTFSILSKLHPGKVVLMSYPKKDRYAVHYKNKCNVVAAAKGSKK